jgi:hypothetical protein
MPQLNSFLHSLPYRTDSPESESESELLYDWQFTANQFVLATSPLRFTTSIYFQMNTFGHSPYVTSLTSSLTRGWVCRLQLLLTLASAVILRSESRGTHHHILLSEVRGSQPEGPDPVFISPHEQSGPVMPPKHCLAYNISAPTT